MKKRKLTKAQEAKLKASEKAKAKKKQKKKNDSDDDYDDEDDDPYSKLSMYSTAKPAAGSFADCAKCETKFTVTKYTQPAVPPPGWLCHSCAKAAGIDAFKKPAAPRKRKVPADKRKVVNFEEATYPSLVSMCVKIISKYINDVEALGDISALSMDSISKAICKNRSLSSQNVQLLYGVERESLTLHDATNLDSSSFSTMAHLNPSLTSLRLDFCGRIDNSSISTWSSPASFPSLTHLELLGPFLIRAPAWCTFFVSHPQLNSFKITQSPRFNLACVESLVENCQFIQELRLCEVGELNDEFLPVIAQYGTQLLYIDFSGPVTSFSDDAVTSFLQTCGENLRHLDLSSHILLTDATLTSAIRPHCSSLTSLVLRDLPELTSNGVSQLFGIEHKENPKTQKTRIVKVAALKTPLQNLDMGRNTLLSTPALSSLLSHSSSALQSLNISGWKDTEEVALLEIGEKCKKLERVDVGWCREVTDFVVNEMMRGCEGLVEVKVWGCNKITVDCPRRKGVSIRGVESHTSF